MTNGLKVIKKRRFRKLKCGACNEGYLERRLGCRLVCNKCGHEIVFGVGVY